MQNNRLLLRYLLSCAIISSWRILVLIFPVTIWRTMVWFSRTSSMLSSVPNINVRSWKKGSLNDCPIFFMRRLRKCVCISCLWIFSLIMCICPSHSIPACLSTKWSSNSKLCLHIFFGKNFLNLFQNFPLCGRDPIYPVPMRFWMNRW